jgi:methyl-accepting chemotaxis protein
MESIALSAEEQATGLAQGNSAINQMDQSTQRNAAMVEESNAATASLAQASETLRSMMSGSALEDSARHIDRTSQVKRAVGRW